MNTPHASPSPVDLAAESVAGEEDPGASIDLAVRDAQGAGPGPSAAASSHTSPGASDQPAGVEGTRPGSPTPAMSPGDEAPPGTVGTGEDSCRLCGGTGSLNGGACPDCEGTGKVTVGIGGA